MYYDDKSYDISEALELLSNHTQYYVPVDDLWAFDMAVEALSEKATK